MSLLDDEIQTKIDEIIENAYEEFEKGNYVTSYGLQKEAWELFPDPKNKWNEAYNIARYIFEDKVFLNELDSASEWLKKMWENHETLGLSDGEIQHLQAKFDFLIGNYSESYKMFKYAVENFGYRYFEDEDPKYLDFYKNPEKCIK